MENVAVQPGGGSVADTSNNSIADVGLLTFEATPKLHERSALIGGEIIIVK
jgi:hypothetical protein